MEEMREQGRIGGVGAYENLGIQQMENLQAGQQKGRDVHSARAQVLHSTPAKSPIEDKIEFAHNVWKCRYNIIDTNGEVFNCDFQCCENMSLLSFTHVSIYEVQLLLVNHKVQDVKCNMSVHGLPCQGDCYPTSLPHEKIGMTCKKCHQLSTEGL